MLVLDRQLDRPGGMFVTRRGRRRVAFEAVVFSSDVFRGPTCLVVPPWVLKVPASIHLYTGNTFVLRCVCVIHAPEHKPLIS